MAHKPLIHFPGGSAAGNQLNIESGGRLRDNQAAEGAQPAIVFHHDFVFSHVAGAAASTRTITLGDGMEIVDVTVLKSAAGSSGTTALTFQVKSSTGGAITGALSAKGVVGTLTRATAITDSLKTVAPGGTLKCARAGTAGSTVAGVNIAGIVRVFGVKRSLA